LGAAVQAIWCDTLSADSAPQAQLAALCDRFVQLDDSSRTQPDPANVAVYESLYQNYLALLTSEYPEVTV
ncbi:hypothetical protein UA45_18415, partial [Morganella morganii]